jgi:hypothetical protein
MLVTQDVIGKQAAQHRALGAFGAGDRFDCFGKRYLTSGIAITAGVNPP